MAITAFRDMKPVPQLLFSAFVILACFLVFMVGALLIAIPFVGLSAILELSSVANLSKPESIIFLKYFQTMQAIGLFVVPPLILAYLFQGNIRKYLYLKHSADPGTFLMVVVLMLAVAPLINFLGALNSQMTLPDWMGGIEQWMRNSEENAALLTEAFLDVKTVWGLAFNLFMVALLPAIGEELLFRGIIQKIFTRMTHSTHWGIWIAAILFSAMHMQFFGFVPRMLLGALFGYLLVWSGSMWFAILGHFINNALAVIVLYFVNNGTVNPSLEEYGSTADSYYATLLSLILTAVLLWQIKKQNSALQTVE